MMELENHQQMLKVFPNKKANPENKTPSAQILVSKCHSQPKRTRAPWKKWLIPRLGQGKYKMNLEHLVVPENKEVLRKRWTAAKRTQESSSCWLNMGHFEHRDKE